MHAYSPCVLRRCHGHDTAFMSRFTDDAVETLAVLAECDAAVFSFGSFGWWAAWLAGGVRSNHPSFNRSIALLLLSPLSLSLSLSLSIP